MKYVYLAGPIAGLTFGEADEWRDYAEQTLPQGWKALSPLRGKDHLDTGTPLSNDFDGGAEAVARDLRDIDCSDALIAYFGGARQISAGTMAELGYAYAKGVPIIVVTDGDEFHRHVFVDFMSDWNVEQLNDAIDILENLRVRRTSALAT